MTACAFFLLTRRKASIGNDIAETLASHRVQRCCIQKQDHGDITCEEDTSLGCVNVAPSAKDNLFNQTHMADTAISTNFKLCAKGKNGTDASNIQQGPTNCRNIHSQESSQTFVKVEKTSSVLVNQQVQLKSDPNQGRIRGQGDKAYVSLKPLMEEVTTYDSEGSTVKVSKYSYKLEKEKCLNGKSQQEEIFEKVTSTKRKEVNESRSRQASEVPQRVVVTNHLLERNLQPQATAVHEHNSNFSTGPGPSTGNKQNHQLVKQNCKEPKDNVIRSDILQPLESFTDSFGIHRRYYGSAKCNGKVIILVGASGSGKTTLVEFIANYFKDVETADDELFRVNSPEHSSTTSITAYTFSFSEKRSPITIIDTPGLSNSSRNGVEDNLQSIKSFLANTQSENFDIHAIGFIAQAHQTHLSSSERLFVEYVSTLFGQVVVNHFITFVTFVTETHEVHPVETAMKDCGMKCKIFVNFSNSIFSSNGAEEINDLDRLYWKIGRKSWKKCLKFIQELPALSVNTLKTSQSKVYETTVSESAERNLRAEIKRFIDFCQELQHMSEEAVRCREHVWGCASLLHKLQSKKDFGVSDVTSIIIAITEEVCKQNAFNPKDCIEQLCLATSRGLLGFGIGIVQGFGPLYENAKTYSRLQEKSENNVPKTMYCSVCKDKHNLERKESSGSMNYIPNFGLGEALITFKCQICDCGAANHKNSMFIPASQQTWNLSPGELLQHVNERISQVLKKNSPRGYMINKDEYLHHVNSATNLKYQALIQDLLEA